MPDIKRQVTEVLFSERESEIKHPGFDAEMALYNLISDGKIDQVRERWAKAPKSNATERGILSEDPVRNMMYHMVTMTALVTRFCIAKGMPEDLAYKLSDVYIKGADELNSVEDIQELQLSMVKNFAEYMMKKRSEGATSKQIRECLNYIRKNIHSNITVSELAEVVDLNETYLSKLFKKEMHCTVSEFIRDEKIAEACWLLRYTDKTSIEIATDLSFSSHSYFISVFKKVKGVTPKEYRNYTEADMLHKIDII